MNSRLDPLVDALLRRLASGSDHALPDVGGRLARARAGSGDWQTVVDDLDAIPADWELPALERAALLFAAATELDPLLARLLAACQAPAAGTRPSLGLLARMLDEPGALPRLAAGRLQQLGLTSLRGEDRALVEAELLVPAALALALAGEPGAWPDQLPASASDALPPDWQALVEELDAAREPILLRARDRADAELLAIATTGETGALLPPAAWMRSGWAAWACLARRRPLLQIADTLPPPPPLALPLPAIAVAGSACRPRDGRWRLLDVPLPEADERAALWRRVVGDAACGLPPWHRHGPARIATLGRIAGQRARAARRDGASEDDLAAALWQAQEDDLGHLAQPLRDRVPDQALVLDPALRAELQLVAEHCRRRHELDRGLGVATRSRRRQGVIACFHGPSGTGKTLAAAWLATRLDLPLYAVDLSALSSKYIGETEKNLAQLLDTAERSQVVLLFDEADALFAKRTEVRDANDRYANQLTNYLLQRLEAFDGIAVLTANALGRIDQAFLRRLDHVCAFPPPTPAERLDLWQRHLGDEHAVAPALLRRIATVAELPGGAIRKAVLGAALRARSAGHPIAAAELLAALAVEFRTLGRDLPGDLADGAH